MNNDVTYGEALQRMLLKGGDTDTNAAIVGGMMGAAVGIEGIPKEWYKAVK